MAFNWKNPDYTEIWNERAARLIALKDQSARDPRFLPGLKAFYKANPIRFVNDWGITVDPRVKAKGRPSVMPFIMFQKQLDLAEFMLECIRNCEPGIVEKSRGMGASWIAISLCSTICLFDDDVTFGFGSAKKDKVDRLGDPDSLFFKARLFLEYLPREFLGTWDRLKHAPEMRLTFPDTQSSITGECGDNIGRGGRKLAYIIDEAAHLEHPELVDSSLSETTETRIDISSVKGMANSFAARRWSGNVKVFTFHYRDDPRKDDEWVRKKKASLNSITIWNQEYEIDYAASVEGIVIPAEWVSMCVDAHLKLGFEPEGIQEASLDLADQGIDKNAIGWRHGFVLKHAQSWSGKLSDLFATCEAAFLYCDQRKLTKLIYDADGLGASMRGDARKLNELREQQRLGPKIMARAFRGSAKVHDPEKFAPGTKVKNKDYFGNFKAQSWFALRWRFEQTVNALLGRPYDPENLISICSQFGPDPLKCERAKLCVELSQPVYYKDGAGRIIIDKVPDGVASPNLADMVMMLYGPRKFALTITDDMMEETA